MSRIRDRSIDFKLVDRPDMPSRRVLAGEVVFAEGDKPTEMYFVRQGKIEIRVNGRAVEEVGPGGIFGEMALIDYHPRSATAIAVNDAEVVPIDEHLFIVLVQETPHFALDVMRTLAERIRAMNERL